MKNSRKSPASEVPMFHHHPVSDAATELYLDGKKFANALYEEGCHKVEEAQETVKHYSDDMIQKVRERPLTALLIASGIGFLLSSFLKK